MSFGAELHRHRVALGVSLEQIAEATKLPVRQLELLEDDRLEQLPGGIFRRGLVRAYCATLGLPHEEWLKRQPASDDDPDGQRQFAENVRRSRTGTGAPRSRWFGVLALVAVLVAVGWAVWHFVLRPRLGH